ncbi:MAG: hypothetical protein JO328_14595 [Hyphomicrobiales bacterium]|nr:hypothetical protein [Hyphomicrobiales bacterium]
MWVPVSRLREAHCTIRHLIDPSAGEGRSENIMLEASAKMPQGRRDDECSFI